MRKVYTVIFVVIIVFALTSCSSKTSDTTEKVKKTSKIATEKVSKNTQEGVKEEMNIDKKSVASDKVEDLMVDKNHPLIEVTMKKGGNFYMELYPEKAPITVENFLNLTKKGFYNGLMFHRVVPGFVAQTGDPTGTGTGGSGKNIKDEYNDLKHKRGAVGMAKTREPNSATSQFYICFQDQPHLDGNYTVFGYVIKGMDVVDGIVQGDSIKEIKIVNSQETEKHNNAETK